MRTSCIRYIKLVFKFGASRSSLNCCVFLLLVLLTLKAAQFRTVLILYAYKNKHCICGVLIHLPVYCTVYQLTDQ